MKHKIRSIAVITPGGDAPGMNTAIRAVVRTAIYHGVKVWGIEKGWYGLMNGLLKEMETRSVSGIINQGGTILHTYRCKEFREKSNRVRAYKNLVDRSIGGLVVIGGDGSMAAAHLVMTEAGIPVNVVPGTIDNDIPCTDYTIGFDTAVNTAVEAIDKIRDTATSHERLFVVEVMGREKGFIALAVGLVSGAEAILIPEVKYDLNKVVDLIKAGQKRGKESFIVVAAEGAGDVRKTVEYFKKKLSIEVRLSILGHIQRGGTPSAFSRELACKLGTRAVETLLAGKAGYLVGAISDKVCLTPISKVVRTIKKVDLDQLRIADMLAS